MFHLEVCVDSLDAAVAASRHLRPGDRLEVCANLLSSGGITPSVGLIRVLRERFPWLKLMIMIRPRPGSFVYSDNELDVMLADILAAKDEGAYGVVFGCLTQDGEVDTAACERLVQAARPLEVTYHRAFDVTSDWRRACDAVASVPGITRILTSGHARTALEGLEELERLTTYIRQKGYNLKLLPGSGINPASLDELYHRYGLFNEAHLSSGGAVKPPIDPMLARGHLLGFGTGEMWRLDPNKLAGVRGIVDMINERDEGASYARGGP